MQPGSRFATIAFPSHRTEETMARKSRRKGAARPQFKLASPDIRPNGPIALEQVFNGFGCSGQNISPALKWSGAPADTKSFALLVHDPDAPTGGAGWWHWVVVNIPAGTTELGKDAGKAETFNLPFGGRQAAPLQLHALRAEGRAARRERRDRLARRLHGERQRDRQGEAHGEIRAKEVKQQSRCTRPLGAPNLRPRIRLAMVAAEEDKP